MSVAVSQVFSTDALGASHVVFAVLTTSFNLGIIAAILKDKHLRTSGMHVPILGIAIVDLLNGSVLCSIAAYRYLAENPSMCDLNVPMAIMSYVFDAIAMYSLFLLFLNHLMHSSQPNESRQRKIGFVGVGIIYILSIVIVSVTLTQERLEPNVYPCSLVVTQTVLISMPCLTYLFPVLLQAVTGLAVLVIHSTSFQSTSRNQMAPMNNFPSHIILAGFVVTAMGGPYVFWRMIGMIPNIFSCFIGQTIQQYVSTVLSFIYLAKSFVLPCVWFLDVEFYTGFLSLLQCGRKTPGQQLATSMVTYNNYNPQVNQTEVMDEHQLMNEQPQNDPPFIIDSNFDITQKL